ncbi:equilibrative nucleobase transporter 1-like [Chiloscyllium punctatum]|uniref:equilibrative nucleobase transporter 1-like n=1 Tax=Chiloscyllium punctatum TaxID=137246 RepID=UPI003B641A11
MRIPHNSRQMLSIKVKQYLTFANGLFECLCFGGVIFGWASLVFVLKKEGYFSDLCDSVSNISHHGERNSTVECDLQDQHFALVFTLASFSLSFITLPCGFLFDYCGTMVTRFTAISLYTSANLMIAFSTPDSAILLFPAACMIAGGGILFFTTNIQVGNLFGNKRATVITLYNGAFGSSAAMYLLVKGLYESGVSLRSMFIFISCFSSIHICSTLFLLPRTQIPNQLPKDYSYGNTCTNFGLKSLSRAQETPSQRKIVRGGDGTVRWTPRTWMEVEEPGRETSKIMQLDRGDRMEKEEMLDGWKTQTKSRGGVEEETPSFRSCIFSKVFLTHLLWLSVIQLRHFLYIGTLNPMLNLLTNGDSGQVSRLTNAFAITQMCSVFCAPWNGLIMDRRKDKRKRAAGFSADCATSKKLDAMMAAVLSLTVTVTHAVLFAVCATIPVLQVQYLTFILQVISRTFLYGGDAAFISLMFPSCHFGKVYGLMQALSAVISLLQYPCFTLIQGPLHGDPFYLNLGFIAMLMLAYIHPVNVYLHCRQESQRESTCTHHWQDNSLSISVSKTTVSPSTSARQQSLHQHKQDNSLSINVSKRTISPSTSARVQFLHKHQQDNSLTINISKTTVSPSASARQQALHQLQQDNSLTINISKTTGSPSASARQQSHHEHQQDNSLTVNISNTTVSQSTSA